MHIPLVKHLQCFLCFVCKINSVIYSYSGGRIDCDEEYIGEPSRTFVERFKEHLKAPSPIYDHQNNSGHKTTIENFQIIGREGNSMARTIKEAMYIRVKSPTLNRILENIIFHTFWTELCFPSQKINKQK